VEREGGKGALLRGPFFSRKKIMETTQAGAPGPSLGSPAGTAAQKFVPLVGRRDENARIKVCVHVFFFLNLSAADCRRGSKN
jgi:hypothetical protein